MRASRLQNAAQGPGSQHTAPALQRYTRAAARPLRLPAAQQFEHQPAPDTRRPQLADTEAAVRDMLINISSSPIIAVDCEGTDLNRVGKLCLLALAISDGRTWVIDVMKLGPSAFGTQGPGYASLRDILQSPNIIKLMWDPRMDSDALYHQCQVELKHVLDLQVVEVAHRKYVQGHQNVRRVTGLAKVIAQYLPGGSDMGFLAEKKAMIAKFDQDPKFWERRPLTEDMLAYCGHDVVHLFELEPILWSNSTAKRPEVATKVWMASDERTREWALPQAPSFGPHMAIAPSL